MTASVPYVFRFLVAPLFLVLSCLGAFAGDPVSLADGTLKTANLHGTTRAMVPATGGDGSFKEALRMEVAVQPQHQWDAQLAFPTTKPVAKGDVITVAAWMRGAAFNAEDGAALVEMNFERRGAPYTKSVQYPAFLSEDWQLITAKCRSVEAYEQPGGGHVTIKMGFMAGWYEIAGVEVLNHGPDADYDALPASPISYTGREADAAWRAEADARIEKHRKADLRIIVVDKQGKRVPGAKVRVAQKNHEFAFGTAVGVRSLMEEGETGDRYRAELQKYFNSVTHENGFKWKAWESKWPGAANTVQSLAKVRDMGMTARGHVMVWPGWRYLSEEVKALSDRPEELRQRVYGHIASVAGATRGQVEDWDVVNEIYDNRDLTNILGDDEPIRWFEEARKHLPDTDLYYNDYAALVSAGLDTGHKRHFEKTVKMLVDGGAPIDGLGLQGHFGLLLTPPEKLVMELDRWAKFGLKIKVTELDIVTDDEQLQGEYTRDFLTAMFSHPAVVGVTVWGFWSKRHWRPNAAFLRDDWSERPAGREWRKLVNETWRTNEEVTTDSNGEAVVRGFRGRYEIQADSVPRQVDLPQGGGIVTVVQW